MKKEFLVVLVLGGLIHCGRKKNLIIEATQPGE